MPAEVRMAKKTFQNELLSSDQFAQYSLRASFFLRKLRAMRLWNAIDEVRKLARVRSGFPWDKRAAWGIDEAAWQLVSKFGFDPLLIFMHPRVLAEQPHLLLYYRTVALISQKGLASLVGGDIARIEAAKVEKLDPQRQLNITIALNAIISSLVNTAPDIQADDLAGLQFASAGATIQGAWNNAVGTEGEHIVRTILVNHLRQEVSQVVFREGKPLDYDARDTRSCSIVSRTSR